MTKGRHIAFVAALLFFPLFAYANPAATIADHAPSGDEIALRDGRIVRLAGIKDLSLAAQDYLQANVAGHEVVLLGGSKDRYGRIVATVSLPGQNQSIEDGMLSAGVAFVYPATGDNPQLDIWLKEEHDARAAKRGYWADHADIDANDAEQLEGQYGFVSGTITNASRVKNKVYLNFGADWRTDFTISIAAHDLRAFKKQDVDLLSLAGRKVRVRGWVKSDFGPMITITDPHQLEILP